jgi:PEP-CTERM motif
MNKTIKTAVLASAGLALVSSSALAAGVSYADSDVLLSFTKVGAANDFIVDLGNVSAFSQTTSFDLSTKLFNSADLLSAFGGSLSGVTWSVWAGNGATGTAATYQSWLSSASSTPWNNQTSPTIHTQDNNITSFGGQDIGGVSGVLVAGSTTEYDVAQTATTSYHTYGGKIKNSFAQGTTAIGDGVTFGTKAYFTDIAVGSGPGTLLGDFTINATTGDGMWNGANSAVPEPATYGVLAGAGLLLLSLRRKLGLNAA